MNDDKQVANDAPWVVATIIACALAIALIVGTPIALITWGNVSHYNACTTLPDRSQRLACLTGGTLKVQAVRACGSLIGVDTPAFDQCIAEATSEPYASSSARSVAASSSTASGGN